jgi:hypothetical protein
VGERPQLGHRAEPSGAAQRVQDRSPSAEHQSRRPAGEDCAGGDHAGNSGRRRQGHPGRRRHVAGFDGAPLPQPAPIPSWSHCTNHCTNGAHNGSRGAAQHRTVSGRYQIGSARRRTTPHGSARPAGSCKTPIRRFDSDRRLQVYQLRKPPSGRHPKGVSAYCALAGLVTAGLASQGTRARPQRVRRGLLRGRVASPSTSRGILTLLLGPPPACLIGREHRPVGVRLDGRAVAGVTVLTLVLLYAEWRRPPPVAARPNVRGDTGCMT